MPTETEGTIDLRTKELEGEGKEGEGRKGEEGTAGESTATDQYSDCQVLTGTYLLFWEILTSG
jgi:hypothetical protein